MALGPVRRARRPRRRVATLAALALASLSAASHADVYVPPPPPARKAPPTAPRAAPAARAAPPTSTAPPPTAAAAVAADDEIPRSGPQRSDEPRSTGREVVPARARPGDAAVKQAACSFTEAVCVRAAESVAPAAVMRT